jgi:hypothetical protein
MVDNIPTIPLFMMVLEGKSREGIREGRQVSAV